MTTMFLGLILAVASALATNLSFLFKQRGAVLAAPIHVRHPLKSASGLFRSRWFAIGWAVSVLAWLMHAGALSRAPLSTVQAVLSGGLAFLAVLAERFFGFHLGRRQWLGVMITAAGLTIVGLTGGGRGAGRSSLAALIAVESAVFALGAGLVAVSTHHSVKQRREGLLLATAAGALFGVSDVAVKYLTHAHGPALGLISPWTLTAVTSFVISFYASARSLQVGAPDRGHRDHLGHRKPGRDPRRHPDLRRIDRLRSRRDHRPHARVPPGHRRRSHDPGATTTQADATKPRS